MSEVENDERYSRVQILRAMQEWVNQGKDLARLSYLLRQTSVVDEQGRVLASGNYIKLRTRIAAMKAPSAVHLGNSWDSFIWGTIYDTL